MNGYEPPIKTMYLADNIDDPKKPTTYASTGMQNTTQSFIGSDSKTISDDEKE